MSSAIAQRAASAQQGDERTIRDTITEHSEEISKALGNSITPEHFIRGVFTTLTANPDLQNATEQSLIAAILFAAQLKLEIGNGLNQFHLTPRTIDITETQVLNGQNVKVKTKRLVCVPMIGYQGYVDLGYRHPRVLDYQIVRVREGDYFDFSYTTELGKAIVWRPVLPLDMKAAYVGGIVRSKLAGGGVTETYLTRDQIEARRPAYTKEQEANGKSWIPNTPWKTDWEAMADKSLIREHQKLTPKSIEMLQVMALDGRVLEKRDGEISAALDFDAEFGEKSA